MIFNCWKRCQCINVWFLIILVHFFLILGNHYFDTLLPCSHSAILICFRALPIGLTSLFPEASCMWKAGNSVKDGGTNSVALGWMYIDWCLRITAWRPPLPPTLAGSRWLTASDMVRIPFEMVADEERKKNIKDFWKILVISQKCFTTKQ